MRASQTWFTEGPTRLRYVIGFVIAVAFVVVAVTSWQQHRAQRGLIEPASSADISDSLAHGVAWIWPGSNGPLSDVNGKVMPYREAAVLTEALVLREYGVEHIGRTQGLPLPPGVRFLPVVHVEAAADAPANFTPPQREAIMAAVRRQAPIAAASSGWLQIDFEAPARERDAYRALLASVRQELPTGVRLSVTALAHWCAQGDWLDRLPVDEVVPMLYRLGSNAQDWRRRIAQGDLSLAHRCRESALGFATNDPPPRGLLARISHPYWFDEASWSNPSRPPRHLGP